MSKEAATPHSNIFCWVSRRLILEMSRRAVLVNPPTSETWRRERERRKRRRERERRKDGRWVEVVT